MSMTRTIKPPSGSKDTVTTSLSLDEPVAELIRKWQYLTDMSRNEVMTAVATWILLKNSLAMDLSLKSLKTLQKFLEALGVSGIDLKYLSELRILVRLRNLVDRGDLSPEDPLLARVTERLRKRDPFSPYQPNVGSEDLEKVEGEVAEELLKEFPNALEYLGA